MTADIGSIVRRVVGERDEEILMRGGCAQFATRLSTLLGGEVAVLLFPADPDFGAFMRSRLADGGASGGWLAREWRDIEATRGPAGLYDFRLLLAGNLHGVGQWIMAHCYVLLADGTAVDASGARPEGELLEKWAEDEDDGVRWGARGVYPGGDDSFSTADDTAPDLYPDEDEDSGYAGLNSVKTGAQIADLDGSAKAAVARIAAALRGGG